MGILLGEHGVDQEGFARVGELQGGAANLLNLRDGTPYDVGVWVRGGGRTPGPAGCGKER